MPGSDRFIKRMGIYLCRMRRDEEVNLSFFAWCQNDLNAKRVLRTV